MGGIDLERIRNARGERPAGGNPYPERKRSYIGNFTGIAAFGSAVASIACCSSAWKKYTLRSQLDEIEQYAKKLMEERCINLYGVNDLSLAISDQFDIPELIKKLTYYNRSEAIKLENSINDFDTLVSAKNSSHHAIDAGYEDLTALINSHKNRIGNPKNLLFTAGIVFGTGYCLFK